MEPRVGLFLPSLAVTAAPGAPLGLVHDCGAWGARAACEPRGRDPGWSPHHLHPGSPARDRDPAQPQGRVLHSLGHPVSLQGCHDERCGTHGAVLAQHPLPREPRPKLPCGSGDSAHRQPCSVPRTCGCSPRRALRGAVEPQTQTRAHSVSRSFIARTRAGQGSQLIPGFGCPKRTGFLRARAVLRGLGHLEKAAVRHRQTHSPCLSLSLSCRIRLPAQQRLGATPGWVGVSGLQGGGGGTTLTTGGSSGSVPPFSRNLEKVSTSRALLYSTIWSHGMEGGRGVTPSSGCWQSQGGPMSAPTYLSARPRGEVVQGGEAFDSDVLQLVGHGVQLGNDDVLVVLVALTQLLPGRCHRLAVGAPRCVYGTGTVPGDEPGAQGSRCGIPQVRRW